MLEIKAQLITVCELKKNLDNMQKLLDDEKLALKALLEADGKTSESCDMGFVKYAEGRSSDSWTIEGKARLEALKLDTALYSKSKGNPYISITITG